MKKKLLVTKLLFCIVLLIPFSGIPVKGSLNQNDSLELHLNASRYNFTPNKFYVDYRQNITIYLHALDRIHGFYLEGYEISQTMCNEHDFSITFTADKIGTFLFKCDEPACGPYHPYMVGSITVRPNNQLSAQIIFMFSSFVVINFLFYRTWSKKVGFKSRKL